MDNIELTIYLKKKIKENNEFLKNLLLQMVILANAIGVVSSMYIGSFLEVGRHENFTLFHIISMLSCTFTLLTGLARKDYVFFPLIIGIGFFYAFVSANDLTYLMTDSSDISFIPKIAVSMAVMFYCMMTIAWFPGSYVWLVIHAISCVAICCVAASFAKEIPYFLVSSMYLSSIFIGFGFYKLRRHILSSYTVNNFSESRDMIPDQVYKASKTTIKIPAMEEIICISCDWRGYQQITAELEPQKVTDILTSYYTKVEAILKRELSGVTYFSDWIADELFVSISTKSEHKNKEQIIASVSKVLLATNHMVQEDFSQDLNLQVDFGMTIGEALTGYIGPPSHRKMTSLGWVPGLARRLQSYGKNLRKSYGKSNYIIMNNLELMTEIQKNLNDKQVITEETNIRDLKMKKITAIALSPIKTQSLPVENNTGFPTKVG